MQKDDKYYSFLFTRQFSSKIYIRRFEVSKKLLHTTSATALLLVITTGIFGFLKFDSLYTTKVNAQPQAIAQQVNLAKTDSEFKTYNYDRPATNGKIGGPNSSGDIDFQLSEGENIIDENSMESELKALEQSGNQQSIPAMWAHLGKVNNEYGYRRNPFGGASYEFHSGVDIDGDTGDPIIAPANGVVTKAGWQGGYGNLIEISHGNGLTTRYGHLSRLGVQVGDTIQRGQLIGLIGSTGRSTGPHLHYEVRLNDRAINPRRFLPPSIQ
jgi:murein DD-endopeptidase MepM/ murein hydrolase activator NlpD